MPRRSTPRAADSPAQQATASLSARYAILCLTVACQAATILMSWPVWNVREQPVNVPLLPWSGPPFGIPLLLSLALILWKPSAGAILHAVVYVTSCLFDQYRLQPQVISLVVLLLACADERGVWPARWYLAALWIWAGLHKFLSPDWWGEQSWHFLSECGIDPEGRHIGFAAVIAVAELGLGIVAALWPRRAALGCLLLHVGILISLSPLIRNFNPSVWPWNLATAVAGWWLLRQQMTPPPNLLRYAVPAALLLLPAGYYADLVNPHLASVLYSGNMPYALHASPGDLKRLEGWGELNVPFPDSPWLFREVFRRTAAPGDKLHVEDPRFGIPDRYFLMLADRTVREVTRERFLMQNHERGEVAGRELEDRLVAWKLFRSGVGLERGDGQLIHSATLRGPQATGELLADAAAALTNLEALRIEEAAISDRSLAALEPLRRLKLLEIENSPITAGALPHISRLSGLRWLRLEGVPVTSDALTSLAALEGLEALLLPQTRIDDRGAVHIGRLRNLETLDLSGTAVTSAALANLRRLENCKWLNLSGTGIDDNGAQHWAALKDLEVLQLARTNIGDRSLEAMASLPGLEQLDLESTAVTDAGAARLASLPRLRFLNLRQTAVSEYAASRLRNALPACRVER